MIADVKKAAEQNARNPDGTTIGVRTAPTEIAVTTAFCRPARDRVGVGAWGGHSR